MSLRTENKIILCPENRCRICLEATSGNIALNQTINYQKAEISLNELLEFCVNEQVCKNGKADGLCLACMEKGIVCYEFKKKFEESQSILLKEIEEGNSFVIKSEKDLKQEDLVEITETEILKEEILDEELLTENNEIVNEGILEEDVLVVATENGVLKEESLDEKVVTENDKILNEEISNEKVQVRETIKSHEDQQDILNTPKRKRGRPTRYKREHSSLGQENAPEYKCEVCEKTFKVRTNFYQHNRRHRQKIIENRKKVPCPTCGRSFYTNYLKVHMMTHSGEKPFPCEYCGRSFSQRSQLVTHRRVHTGERPYKCAECGKGFALKAPLRKHLRIHFKKREHVCHICEEAFFTSSKLRSHIKTHSAPVRPFKCTICNKKFKRRGDLSVHQTTHTGETPHVCKVCGKRFRYICSLKKHMKKCA